MEPEGSLLHSQVSTTCPYPEPPRSSPYPHPTSWRSTLILSSHLCLVSQVVSFPQVSPSKPCIDLSSPQYMLHGQPISCFRHLLHPDGGLLWVRTWFKYQYMKAVLQYGSQRLWSTCLYAQTIKEQLYNSKYFNLRIFRRFIPTVLRIVRITANLVKNYSFFLQIFSCCIWPDLLRSLSNVCNTAIFNPTHFLPFAYLNLIWNKQSFYRIMFK